VHLVGDVNLSTDQRELLCLGPLFVQRRVIKMSPAATEFGAALNQLHRRVRLYHTFADKGEPDRAPFSVETPDDCLRSINDYWKAPNPTWNPLSAPQPVERRFAALRLAGWADFRARPSACVSNLEPHLLAARTKLQARTDIVVRTADKNLGTAVMSASWYNSAVCIHLQDTSNYRVVSHSCDDINKGVAESILRACGLLPGLQSRVVTNLMRVNKICSVPRFYVLPKLHKITPDAPFASRPIAANHSAPTASAAALLSDVLQPIIWSDRWVLKDTLSFVQFIEQDPTTAGVRDSDFLFTADVEALYPSIVIDLAVRIVRVLLLRHFGRDYIVDFLSELLRVVLSSGFVEFAGVIYEQVKGIPMGVSCCTHVGNAYVSHFFSPIVRRWIASGHLVWARGYIDDIVGVWRGSRRDFQVFLAELGEAHPSLRITHATSAYGLPFLDLFVHRGPRAALHGRWDLRTYVKPLNAHAFIPATSAHPPKCLPSFIYGELLRMVRNSSSERAAVDSAQALTQQLIARGYHPRIICSALSKVRYSQRLHYLSCAARRAAEPGVSKLLPLVITYNDATRHLRPQRWFHPNVEQLTSPTHRGVIAWKRDVTLQAALRLQWPKA
jgi:hypothetical protein